MSTEENKALLRRAYEAANQRNLTCGGYFGHPFTKWMILLLISAFSRSCGIHR